MNLALVWRFLLRWVWKPGNADVFQLRGNVFFILSAGLPNPSGLAVQHVLHPLFGLLGSFTMLRHH